MKKLLTLMLAAALALSLVACGGGGGGTEDNSTPSTGNGDTTSTGTSSSGVSSESCRLPNPCIPSITYPLSSTKASSDGVKNSSAFPKVSLSQSTWTYAWGIRYDIKATVE